MLESGFIKLHRSLLSWEWYTDYKTKDVFIHLLLTANYEDSDWRGVNISRGERATSYEKIASETGLSVRNVRTAIEHLKVTGEVTSKSYSKFTVFTLNNYDKYQATDKQTDIQLTNELTGNRQQRKKAKEDNNKCSLTVANSGGFLFDKFWEAYPKKQSKKTAQKAWTKLKVSNTLFDKIMLSLSAVKQSPQWTKDNGQYIPLATTWLNGERWDDEQVVENHFDDMENYMKKFNGG